MAEGTKTPKARATAPKPGTVAYRQKMLSMGKAASYTTGRPFTPARSKTVPGRIVSVLPVDVAEGLDALAVERFGGNRTAALTVAVQLALLVYGHPANRKRFITGAVDALKALADDARESAAER